jgi:hypothetical protein
MSRNALTWLLSFALLPSEGDATTAVESTTIQEGSLDELADFGISLKSEKKSLRGVAFNFGRLACGFATDSAALVAEFALLAAIAGALGGATSTTGSASSRARFDITFRSARSVINSKQSAREFSRQAKAEFDSRTVLNAKVYLQGDFTELQITATPPNAIPQKNVVSDSRCQPG